MTTWAQKFRFSEHESFKKNTSVFWKYIRISSAPGGVVCRGYLHKSASITFIVSKELSKAYLTIFTYFSLLAPAAGQQTLKFTGTGWPSLTPCQYPGGIMRCVVCPDVLPCNYVVLLVRTRLHGHWTTLPSLPGLNGCCHSQLLCWMPT